MAAKATGSTSAAVFLDEVKAAMGGSCSYEPADSTQKWVFAEVSVDDDAALLGTGNDTMDDGTALHANDTYKWVAVKNMSTDKTDGIGINLDGGDSTAIADATAMFISGGEMIILKPVNCTVANLHVGSVTMDSGGSYPNATNADPVTAQVAAIVDTDVG